MNCLSYSYITGFSLLIYWRFWQRVRWVELAWLLFLHELALLISVSWSCPSHEVILLFRRAGVFLELPLHVSWNWLGLPSGASFPGRKFCADSNFFNDYIFKSFLFLLAFGRLCFSRKISILCTISRLLTWSCQGLGFAVPSLLAHVSLFQMGGGVVLAGP